MKRVVRAKWESVARFARGGVAGSQVRWTLTLECGHVAKRYVKSGLQEPKRARCPECPKAASHG